jgi:hypothetical protein
MTSDELLATARACSAEVNASRSESAGVDPEKLEETLALVRALAGEGSGREHARGSWSATDPEKLEETLALVRVLSGEGNGSISNAPPHDAGKMYLIKRIRFLGRNVPVLCQNENGPCPLLAICNILLLRGSIQIHPDISCISSEELIEEVMGTIESSGFGLGRGEELGVRS